MRSLAILCAVLMSCGQRDDASEVKTGLVGDDMKTRNFLWAYHTDAVARPASGIKHENFLLPDPKAKRVYQARKDDKKIAIAQAKFQNLVKKYSEPVEVEREVPGPNGALEKRLVPYLRDTRFTKEREGHCYYYSRNESYYETLYAFDPSKPGDIVNDSGLKILCGTDTTQSLDPVNEYFMHRRPIIDQLNEELELTDEVRKLSSVTASAGGLVCLFLVLGGKYTKVVFGDSKYFACQALVNTITIGWWTNRNNYKNWTIPTQGKAMRSPNGPLYDGKMDAPLNSRAVTAHVLQLGVNAIHDASDYRNIEDFDKYTSFVPCPSAARLPVCRTYRKELVSKLKGEHEGQAGNE